VGPLSSSALLFAVRVLDQPVTLSRLDVRSMLVSNTFPSPPSLSSTGSASSIASCVVPPLRRYYGRPDFSRPCIHGYGFSPSRCGPVL